MYIPDIYQQCRYYASIATVAVNICPDAHCIYLVIYISQKIKLCEGDLEGQFQTSLQAIIMNFLI